MSDDLKLTQISEQTTVATVEQPVEDAPPKAGFSKDTLMNFVPLLLVFVIFYFFVIRPQLKKQKEQDDLVKALKKGDRVIMSGGVFGRIIKEKDASTLVVEIAKDVHIEVLRSAVASLVPKTQPEAPAKK